MIQIILLREEINTGAGAGAMLTDSLLCSVVLSDAIIYFFGGMKVESAEGDGRRGIGILLNPQQNITTSVLQNMSSDHNSVE